MIYVIIGIVSGVISGLGIGGGTILIPALIFFLDIEQKLAQQMNLIYFIPTAIMALVIHAKSGNIEKKPLPKLITLGIIGAIIGSFIGIRIDNNVLKKMFGGFLLIMGIIEFKKCEKSYKE